MDNSSPTTAVESTFLNLSISEFNALQELAQETLRRPAFNTNLLAYSTTNPPPHPVIASDPTPATSDRVYPLITAPFIRKRLPKFVPITTLLHFSTFCFIYMCIFIRLKVYLNVSAYPIFFLPYDALRRVSAFF